MSKLPFVGNSRKMLYVIIALIIGIVLIGLGNVSNTSKDKVSEKPENGELYYSQLLEDRIEDFLKSVNGIKDVRVFVTVDGGTEFEYAQKGNTEGFASDYLIIDTKDGEEAAVVRQIYPQIRGIGVSCTNGDNSTVKKNITSLLSAALGISANKIEVMGYSSHNIQ